MITIWQNGGDVA